MNIAEKINIKKEAVEMNSKLNTNATGGFKLTSSIQSKPVNLVETKKKDDDDIWDEWN